MSTNHNQPEEPDEVLVWRAQKGDESAYTKLVARHREKIYARALSMLRNKDDAVEFSEKAWAIGLERIVKFDGESSFVTWITRIIINLCLDELRRRKLGQQEAPQPPTQPWDWSEWGGEQSGGQPGPSQPPQQPPPRWMP